MAYVNQNQREELDIHLACGFFTNLENKLEQYSHDAISNMYKL